MADGATPEKRGRGRPPTYRSEFCETIIGLGEMGYSQAQMAAHIGVAKATITEWAQQHLEFSNALTRARTLSQSWWESKAQEGLQNRDFNAGLWKASVASRFRDDYTDRVEHVGKDGDAIQIKDGDANAAARKIAFMLGRAIGRQEAKAEVPEKA